MTIDLSITGPNLIPLVQALLGHAGDLVLLLVALGLVVGVVIPAVWSRHRTRRCAAAAVLDRVLQTVERVAAAAARAMGFLARIAPAQP